MPAPSAPTITFSATGSQSTWPKLAGVSYNIIDEPSASSDDLFRHHSHLYYDSTNEVLYAMWSQHPTGEDGPGQHVEYSYSTDGGNTWAAPAELFPPQDNFDRGTDNANSGGRACIPAGFVFANGKIFGTTAVIDLSSSKTVKTGQGTLARSVSEGTLGTIFWIQTDAKPSPIAADGTSSTQSDATDYVLGDDSGVSADATALRTARNVRHQKPTWDYYAGDDGGGVQWLPTSEPDIANADHTEPVSILRSDGNTLRIWRRRGAGTLTEFDATLENADGESSTAGTNIPNSPSKGQIFERVSGDYGLLGNINTAGNRTYLSLLTSSDEGADWDGAYCISQQTEAVLYRDSQETLGSDARSTGVQYPNSCVAGSTEYFIATINKESVCVFCVKPSATGLRNKLASWWEDFSTRKDEHGICKLITFGTVTTSTGVQGGAHASFSGAGGLFLSSNYSGEPFIRRGLDFTIFARVRLDSKASNSTILAMYHSITNDRGFLFNYASGDDRFKFIVSDDGTNSGNYNNVTADTLGSPSTATWYDVMIRHEYGVGIGINVNGGGWDTTAHTAGINWADAMVAIGSSELQRDETAVSNGMNGDIDQLIIWDRLLTSEEQSQVFAGIEYMDTAPVSPSGILQMDNRFLRPIVN